MDDSGSQRPRAFAWIGAFASLTLHALLVWGLWHAPKARATHRLPTRVELTVAPARPEPAPPPVAPPQEPAAPEPRQPPARTRSQFSEPVVEREPAPAPSEPAALDLSGVTLTNDGPGASWSSLAGNGSASSAPNRAGKASAAAQPASARLEGPALVALSDLSRRPAPPALDGLLRQYYPAEARRLALGGVAVVRARIGTSGRVHSASIASETRAGFGAACRKTLLGSRWTPPLDRSGSPVLTDVSYTCRFRVED
ncbi:MAG TPA: energy transducer TonB [Polyangiaceae bacterium]|nr:energy transducer TonB [Polyangiaceae bacterium]